MVREVACPTCRKPALFSPENRWRPFCSQRCRGTDLGAWASEDYRVAAKPEADPSPPLVPSPNDPHRLA